MGLAVVCLKLRRESPEFEAFETFCFAVHRQARRSICAAAVSPLSISFSGNEKSLGPLSRRIKGLPLGLCNSTLAPLASTSLVMSLCPVFLNVASLPGSLRRAVIWVIRFV